MRVLRIAYNSPEYRAALVLRQEVLREPLGLELSAADTIGEDTHLHFIAMEGERLVGTVTFKPLSENAAKLRQMAVAPDLQGMGVGQHLVGGAEEALLTLGYTQVETHARVAAQSFYARMGYEVIGAPFEEVGLPHVTMQKGLTSRV